jgi:multidrug resistance efflux pump
MTRFAQARGWLRPLIAMTVGGALISIALRFTRTVAAPAGPLSPPVNTTAAPAGLDQEGVVCFGTVDLEQGVTSLSPLQPGRVAQVLVAENQEVNEGDLLLRLDDGIAKSRLAAAEAAVELAQLQLVRARKQPRLQRIRMAQQQAMCQAMASRVAAARIVLAHEKELTKGVANAETTRTVSTEKVREIEALQQAEEERLAELEAQDVEADTHRAERELEAAEARRDETRLALEDCHLKAPRPGTVLRIQVGPGDVLGGQPGQPPILFAANGPQVIRATVEQEFARRVTEGAPAQVRDEADPSAGWRGRVGRIAGWYSQRRAVLHDPSQLSDVRTLECLIILEPGQPPLRLGQSVRVSIGRIP